jgi:hypothetical protein
VTVPVILVLVVLFVSEHFPRQRFDLMLHGGHRQTDFLDAPLQLVQFTAQHSASRTVLDTIRDRFQDFRERR